MGSTVEIEMLASLFHARSCTRQRCVPTACYATPVPDKQSKELAGAAAASSMLREVRAAGRDARGWGRTLPAHCATATRGEKQQQHTVSRWRRATRVSVRHITTALCEVIGAPPIPERASLAVFDRERDLCICQWTAKSCERPTDWPGGGRQHDQLRRYGLLSSGDLRTNWINSQQQHAAPQSRCAGVRDVSQLNIWARTR